MPTSSTIQQLLPTEKPGEFTFVKTGKTVRALSVGLPVIAQYRGDNSHSMIQARFFKRGKVDAYTISDPKRIGEADRWAIQLYKINDN